MPTGRSSRSRLGFVGAAAVVVVAALMARSDVFQPLRYCGQNSIVIYLAFFLPMAATRIALLKTGIIADLGTISLLVTAAASSGRWPGTGRCAVRRSASCSSGRPGRSLGPSGLRRCSRRNNSQRLRRALITAADGPHSGHASQIQDSCAKSKAAKPAAAKAAATKASAVVGSLKKGDHVFLVDGSGYIFRAYHALPPLTRKSDGLQINAVLGFCNMLWKLLERHEAGGAADASRRDVRQVGKDLPHRFLSRIQGAPPGRAGRPHPAVPADPRGGARLRHSLPRAGRASRPTTSSRPTRGSPARRTPPPPSSRPTRT